MYLNHNAVSFVPNNYCNNEWDDIERDIYLENIKQNYELSCDVAKRLRDNYLEVDEVHNGNKNREKILNQYDNHCTKLRDIYMKLFVNIMKYYGN